MLQQNQTRLKWVENAEWGWGLLSYYRVIREALYNRLTVGFLGKNVSRQGIQQK